MRRRKNKTQPSPRASRLLEALSEHHPKPVSREHLIKRVYGVSLKESSPDYQLCLKRNINKLISRYRNMDERKFIIFDSRYDAYRLVIQA